MRNRSEQAFSAAVILPAALRGLDRTRLHAAAKTAWLQGERIMESASGRKREIVRLRLELAFRAHLGSRNQIVEWPTKGTKQ